MSASSRKNTNCGWMQMRIVGWRRRDSTNKEKIAPKLNSPQHFPPNGSMRNFMSRSNAANPAERNVQSGVDARVSRCFLPHRPLECHRLTNSLPCCAAEAPAGRIETNRTANRNSEPHGEEARGMGGRPNFHPSQIPL